MLLSVPPTSFHLLFCTNRHQGTKNSRQMQMHEQSAPTREELLRMSLDRLSTQKGAAAQPDPWLTQECRQ